MEKKIGLSGDVGMVPKKLVSLGAGELVAIFVAEVLAVLCLPAFLEQDGPVLVVCGESEEEARAAQLLYHGQEVVKYALPVFRRPSRALQKPVNGHNSLQLSNKYETESAVRNR